MREESLNGWRRAFLLKEEIFSLSDIFVLALNYLKGLLVSQGLGAPSFLMIDEKRWCQASV